MTKPMHAAAAEATAAAADRARPEPRFTGEKFVPVRSDHLAELLRVQAEHGRLLAQIAEKLGIWLDAP